VIHKGLSQKARVNKGCKFLEFNIIWGCEEVKFQNNNKNKPLEGLSYIPPLQGIRVVDLSQIGAGPYGTSMLGDMGADVVKVESLEGESFRYIDNLFGHGDSAYFYGVNRSKRSLTLDLKSQEGQEALQKMVKNADVFVVSFKPDTVDRLDIGYEKLSQLNDQLIYCQITAFGESGPRSHQPGMDILAQALGGIMGLTGEPDGPPIKAGLPIADFLVSYLLGFSVCAGLRARDLNGRGQKISLNLLDGQVSTLANILTHYDRTKVPVRPQGGGHPQIVPYQPFQGADGEYFILACLTEGFWRKLIKVIDKPEWSTDPRYASNPSRVQNRKELIAILSEIFAQKPASYWYEKLDEAGVPCSPVNRLEDVICDPQVVHNESVITLKHPIHGEYPVPNNPIHMQGTPVQPHGYAPRLGEHSREVLEEFDFSSQEIEELINKGVVTVFGEEKVGVGAQGQEK
jgi:crotonobetainyl-CoA:carnitine CoA-transferase CaiB-like acyl-CoA transferase